MRIIKFRAWNKENNIIIQDVYNHKLYKSLNDCLANSNLMQYTGLKDKNGKEIYEGDILHILENGDYGGEYYAEVEYLDSYGIFGIKCASVKEIAKSLTNDRVNTLFTRGFLVRNFGSCISLGEMLNIEQSRFPICEVAGNICENPELLK